LSSTGEGKRRRNEKAELKKTALEKLGRSH